jgi:cytosine/adenosine deaminase-related metal-dependent hydrolase
VLIRNATIWTGAVKGLEVVRGDVLLDQGLVKAVGVVEQGLLKGLEGLVEYDARGAWVTPG